MKTFTDQVRELLLAPYDMKALLGPDASATEKQSAKRCCKSAEQLEALIAKIPADRAEEMARAILLTAEMADGWRCAMHEAMTGRHLERHWRSVQRGGENLKLENMSRRDEADAKARSAFDRWCARNHVLAGLTTAEKLRKYRRVARLKERDSRRLGALLKSGRL
jgi:hypothetical protein